MATTTVTVNGFVRAPGTPVTDGNIAVFDTVTGELIADGGKTIAELTVDKSIGGNGTADAGTSVPNGRSVTGPLTVSAPAFSTGPAGFPKVPVFSSRTEGATPPPALRFPAQLQVR